MYQFNAQFSAAQDDEAISQIAAALRDVISADGDVIAVNGRDVPVNEVLFAFSNNLEDTGTPKIKKKNIFFVRTLNGHSVLLILVPVTDACFLYEYVGTCGPNGRCDASGSTAQCMYVHVHKKHFHRKPRTD